VWLIRARDVEANLLRAGGKQQLVKGCASPVVQHDLPQLGVNSRYPRRQLEIYRLLGVKFTQSQRHPIFRRVPGKIVLRTIWPVVGKRIIRGKHRHLAGKPFPPQHFGGSNSRRAPTHDHDAIGLGAPRTHRVGLVFFDQIDFFAHESFAVASFNAPAPHWIKGWRCDGFAGTQAEACMMPRAS
jgi:hypothetical protein